MKTKKYTILFIILFIIFLPIKDIHAFIAPPSDSSFKPQSFNQERHYPSAEDIQLQDFKHQQEENEITKQLSQAPDIQDNKDEAPTEKLSYNDFSWIIFLGVLSILTGLFVFLRVKKMI